MTRKASAAAPIVAFATVGSALFGGTALAGGNHGDNGDEPVVNNTGGPGGAAGEADGCIIIDSTVTRSRPWPTTRVSPRPRSRASASAATPATAARLRGLIPDELGNSGAGPRTRRGPCTAATGNSF